MDRFLGRTIQSHCSGKNLGTNNSRGEKIDETEQM